MACTSREPGAGEGGARLRVRAQGSEGAACADAVAARGSKAGHALGAACVVPPAERFVGRNDWWAYVACVASLVVPLALVPLGLPPLAAVACIALLLVRTLPPLARNWVDLYADRIVIAFGLRRVTVFVSRVEEVDLGTRMFAPMANSRHGVRLMVAARDVPGMRESAAGGGSFRMPAGWSSGRDGEAWPGEVFVALRDNERFVAALTDRMERLSTRDR